jgi:uracil-DNA glycosylase
MTRSKFTGAQGFLPGKPSFRALRAALPACRGCDLYREATQAVFGEGPSSSQLALVGEEPGNEEDLQGSPFVGPAGHLLDRALTDAGIDRAGVYVTNAVKHFKFEERGKRRLHKKPSATEIVACRPWLESEMLLLRPVVIVCLGATAAQSILGKEYRLTKERGKFVEHHWAPHVTATVHPAAVLRAPDPAQRNKEYRGLVADLKRVRRILETAKQS